jgi:Asp-tRNA(Asn)/Glu-tRNA(Gln) amidotransferase A subunit family amidase
MSTGDSSSGSAAAVSAGLCAGAVGLETYGSIVMPASLCGIVGLKPTVGLVRRSGTIGISITRDVLGPMARTVADVAALLGGMAGVLVGIYFNTVYPTMSFQAGLKGFAANLLGGLGNIPGAIPNTFCTTHEKRSNHPQTIDLFGAGIPA